MAVRHRILWLIHILYYVVMVHSTLLDINDAESCDLLCKQCNVSAIIANDRCECNFSNNNDKEAECIQRLQREIQAIDLNTISEDLTDEERSIRSILKSRRRLRMGDADKVAQYFINGGPAAGHSHFIKAFNAAYDSVDSRNSFSGASDENSPEDEFHGEKPLNDAISWNTYNSPLYMIPNARSCPYPAIPGIKTPIVGMINPVLGYVANGLYDATNPSVGSILHPYRQKHGLYAHHNLHRMNSLPGQILHNLFYHRLSHPVHHSGFRNSNDENPESVGQPAGEYSDSYIVSKDVPIARNNAAKSVEQNAGANFLGSAEPAQYSIQTPYIVSANTIPYEPMEYRRFNVPCQYTSYRNPLINLLHPVTNEYIVQPEYIPHYIPNIPDPLIAASNPNSYCINDTNAEQKDKVSTDKIVPSNNEAEQSSDNNNKIKNNISKEENKAKK